MITQLCPGLVRRRVHGTQLRTDHEDRDRYQESAEGQHEGPSRHERGQRRSRPRTRQASEREDRSLTPRDVPAASARRQRDGGRQPHDDEGQARRLMGITAQHVHQHRNRQDATTRTEGADDDAHDDADEHSRHNHDRTPARDADLTDEEAGEGRHTPREAATAGSMMSEADLPAAISMPIARRAGVACS